MSVIHASLRSREFSDSQNHRTSIVDALEKSFAAGNFMPTAYPLTPNVTSTIAIAISPDGRTVASTHGDHTVKIFDYLSNILLREFRGHPRTPWTVKYQPNDSNILVSGCLGFQVLIHSCYSPCVLIVSEFQF